MSLTSSEAAAWYLERGWQPVPIPGRTKKPKGNDWQFRRFSEKDKADFGAIFPPTNNVGILLGAESGGLVDIDLDCPEAIEFARVYLPSTGMIHGRPLKPLSHYWYRVDKPKDTKKFTAVDRKTLVEIRSSEGIKGFQTIVPPSVHEDTAELIEWVNPGPDGMPGEPALVDYADLESAVRIIAAGSLLARLFPEKGSRHEFSLALSGLLLRYNTPPQDAYNFIYNVARVGGSSDPATRAATVWSTQKKIEDGYSSTGFPRLAEIIGEPATRKVCDWLSLNVVSTEWLGKFVDEGQAGAITTRLFDEKSPVAKAVADDDDDDQEAANWMVLLRSGGRGDKLLPCGYNIKLILRNCAVTKGRFRYDEVANEIVVSPGGPFADSDPEVLPVHVANWLGEDFKLYVRENDVARQILAIALKNRFNPIRDYLESLKWNGESLISGDGGWLTRYAQAEAPQEADSESYVEFVGRKWLIAMVARAYEPGCKADLVLILEGDQGKRKSSLFEALAGPVFQNPKWYVEIASALGDKDSKMLTSGFWVGELPDLASLKKGDQNAVKSFLSLRYDKFRPPYGKVVKDSPRRIVFGGTTNEGKYFSDITGNRRYCPVKCGQVDIASFLRDRDQVLAEAVVLYKKHVVECKDKVACCCWWFTPSEEAIQKIQTAKRQVQSMEHELIEEWWFKKEPKARPSKVTTLDVARGALKLAEDKVPNGLSQKIGDVLARMGFEHKFGEVEGYPRRVWHYVAVGDLVSAPQAKRPSLFTSPFTVVDGGKK